MSLGVVNKSRVRFRDDGRACVPMKFNSDQSHECIISRARTAHNRTVVALRQFAVGFNTEFSGVAVLEREDAQITL